MLSGVGNGNFENSKLFEGLVILRKNTRKGKKEKRKGASHHWIFFSPLPGVLKLMTDSLQGTALNQCRGMEDNRCGRHVLDH